MHYIPLHMLHIYIMHYTHANIHINFGEKADRQITFNSSPSQPSGDGMTKEPMQAEDVLPLGSGKIDCWLMRCDETNETNETFSLFFPWHEIMTGIPFFFFVFFFFFRSFNGICI